MLGHEIQLGINFFEVIFVKNLGGDFSSAHLHFASRIDVIPYYLAFLVWFHEAHRHTRFNRYATERVKSNY